MCIYLSVSAHIYMGKYWSQKWMSDTLEKELQMFVVSWKDGWELSPPGCSIREISALNNWVICPVSILEFLSEIALIQILHLHQL